MPGLCGPDLQRELEVMDAITTGESNKVIAFRLGISQRTVEIHRARVTEKLDARSVADLAHLSAAADRPRL